VQQLLAGGPIPLVVVGFSPPDVLGALADHLGLLGRMFSDPDRTLYRLMGLDRAPLWRIYSPDTLAFYAGRLLRGRTLRKGVEDTRQLGADAVCVDGVITRIWRPATPDDRPLPECIVAVARVFDR
jgi:hypothetical protein